MDCISPIITVILGTFGVSKFALSRPDGELLFPDLGSHLLTVLEVGLLKMGSPVPLPARFEYVYVPNGFSCVVTGFHTLIKNVLLPLPLIWDLTIHPLGGQRLC